MSTKKSNRMESDVKGISPKNLEVFVIPSEQQSVPRAKKRWKIDKEMLGMKLHFLLFVGSLSFVLPYMSLYAKDMIAISATSLGAIATTQQFIFIFSKPLICYIADYFNKLKATIGVLIVFQTIFFFLYFAVPKIEAPQSNQSRFQDLHHLYIENMELLRDVGLLESVDDIYFLNDTISTSNIQLKTHFHNSYNFETDVGESNYSLDQRKLYFLYMDDDKGVKNGENIFKTACVLNNLTISNIFEEKFLGVDDDTIMVAFLNQSQTITILKYFSNSTVREKLVHIERNCPEHTDLETFLNKSSWILIPDNHHNSINNISAHFQMINTTAEDDHSKTFSEFSTYQFWVFGVIFTCANACMNSLFTISDTACCESVRKTGHEYGRQRLFGALSWGIMAPIAGYLIDYTQSYVISWSIMAVLNILTLWNLSKLDLVKPDFSKNILKDVGTVLKTAEFSVFLLGVFINGLGVGVIWFYLVWFIATIGGSRFLCGMVNLFQCFLGEIPCMFFSDWFINKVGHFQILTLSLMAYCLRFLWYSYLNNPWLILPVEVLHGLTYGIFYPAVASYASISAKPGTEATTQAVLFATYEGLGAGLGCVLAGLSFDYFGGHMTFFYGSIMAGIGMIIHIVNTFIVKSRKNTSPEVDKNCRLSVKIND